MIPLCQPAGCHQVWIPFCPLGSVGRWSSVPWRTLWWNEEHQQQNGKTGRYDSGIMGAGCDGLANLVSYCLFGAIFSEQFITQKRKQVVIAQAVTNGSQWFACLVNLELGPSLNAITIITTYDWSIHSIGPCGILRKHKLFGSWLTGDRLFCCTEMSWPIRNLEICCFHISIMFKF